mgnify:CR=1 FL=1
MNSKYKILVTGAAGFLGSHLVEKLKNLGHTVIGIDNMMGGYKDNIIEGVEFHELDCCDLQNVQKIMRGVDIVYHCAATAHEGLSVFSPYEITKNNYLASVSIFTAAIIAARPPAECPAYTVSDDPCNIASSFMF